MTRVWHPYTEWEDYTAGMWETPTDLDNETRTAAGILADPDIFRDAARFMLADWTRAAEQNLSGPVPGRRAWIGQATCCHLAGVREEATRTAWWVLTPAEQYRANQVADEVIVEWERARGEYTTPGLFTIDLGAREPEIAPHPDHLIDYGWEQDLA